MGGLPLELVYEGRRLGNRLRIWREDETIRVVDALDIQCLRRGQEDGRIALLRKEEVLQNDLELRGGRDACAHHRLLIPRRNPPLHARIPSLCRGLSAIEGKTCRILLVNINVNVKEEEL